MLKSLLRIIPKKAKVRKGGADKYIWHIVKTLLFFRERG